MTRWIHGLSKELLRAAFCEYFGVSVEHSDILILLYERPNESVTTRKMCVLLDSHRPPRRGTVHERIRVLREIMEAESLDSGGQLDDTGYQLTEIGMGECVKALRAVADVLLRHGPMVHIPGVHIEEIRRPKALPAPDDGEPLRTPLGAASC